MVDSCELCEYKWRPFRQELNKPNVSLHYSRFLSPGERDFVFSHPKVRRTGNPARAQSLISPPWVTGWNFYEKHQCGLILPSSCNRKKKAVLDWGWSSVFRFIHSRFHSHFLFLLFNNFNPNKNKQDSANSHITVSSLELTQNIELCPLKLWAVY